MKREIQPLLRSSLVRKHANEVLNDEGARQVGKSYLVHSVLSEIKTPHLSFDLEKDTRVRREIDKTEDFRDFKSLMTDRYELQSGMILFIDEAQESRKLPRYVKSLKEDWKEIRVILTGSSMKRFFSQDVRIPVGRTMSLCIFGFSFTEFLRFVKGDEIADYILSCPTEIPASRHELLLELFDRYMYVGGYPEAVKAFCSGEDYPAIIEEILANLEEDFARNETHQPELFRNVLQAVSNYIGTPSKYTHIDTTKHHARRIIEAMKAWHLILEVTPQSLQPLHSRFLPKRYLYDLGVVNLMRAQAVPKLSLMDSLRPELRTPIGGIFENAALINILSGKSARKSVYTWKKGNNTSIEVDFILNLNTSRMDVKLPVECKAATKLKKRHFSNLIQYLKLTDQSLGVMISAAPYEKFLLDDSMTITNIPIYMATQSNIVRAAT